MLFELLDASAALWNQITYHRRQAFFDDKSVWQASNPSDRYKDVLGSATAQQIPRKNSEAWRSFSPSPRSTTPANATRSPRHLDTGIEQERDRKLGRPAASVSQSKPEGL